MKDGIVSSKGPALAAISVAEGGSGGGGLGTGFLIHRNLLLTSHANLPSAPVAEAAEIRLCHGRLPARLVPQRSVTNPCSANSFYTSLSLGSLFMPLFVACIFWILFPNRKVVGFKVLYIMYAKSIIFT